MKIHLFNSRNILAMHKDLSHIFKDLNRFHCIFASSLFLVSVIAIELYYLFCEFFSVCGFY